VEPRVLSLLSLSLGVRIFLGRVVEMSGGGGGLVLCWGSFFFFFFGLVVSSFLYVVWVEGLLRGQERKPPRRAGWGQSPFLWWRVYIIVGWGHFFRVRCCWGVLGAGMVMVGWAGG